MRNTETRVRHIPEPSTPVAVVRRRQPRTVPPVNMQKKLEADLADWLKQRRSAR